MKLIVVSWPGIIRRESKIIEKLFKQGLDFYHLRKPQTSTQYVRTVLNSLPEDLLNRVVLHDHPALLDEFSLGGWHVNDKNIHLEAEMKGKTPMVTRSFHDLDKLKNEGGKYNYAWISPVFTSVSKDDYYGVFSLEELRDINLANDSINVVALGGILPENIERVDELGFWGAAMIGGVWLNEDTVASEGRIIDQFQSYQDVLSEKKSA